jgi:hypothetical protein
MHENWIIIVTEGDFDIMIKVLRDMRFWCEKGRDEFLREQVADKVIKLLCSDIDVSPMVVDGNWGTGKTEFCHKLINKFKDEHEDYRILYIDAFRADHADDALMTILAEVLTLIPIDKKENFLKKAVPVIRFGIKTLLKSGVSHVLRENADDIADELEDHIQDTANAAIDATVRAMLKEHDRAEQSLEALQNTLRDIAKSNPIVIFIDELDRCRPNYAVQVLEVMKHTFDVEGVSFVLVTNTSQLRAAVNHQYGAVVDAQRYLDKFLKFRFQLPDFVKQSEYSKWYVSDRYFDSLVNESEILKICKLGDNSNGVLNVFCKEVINRNELSLREINTFVKYLEIYSVLKDNYKYDWHYSYEAVTVISIFIYCFRPGIQSRINSGIYSGKDICSVFGFKSAIRVGERPTKQLSDVIGWYLCSNAREENDYWLSTPSAELNLMRSEFSSNFKGFDTDELPSLDYIIQVFDVLRLA